MNGGFLYVLFVVSALATLVYQGMLIDSLKRKVGELEERNEKWRAAFNEIEDYCARRAGK